MLLIYQYTSDAMFKILSDREVLIIGLGGRSSTYKLRGLASITWLSIDGKKTVPEIINTVAERGRVAVQHWPQLKKDVESLLIELCEKGALVVINS